MHTGGFAVPRRGAVGYEADMWIRLACLVAVVVNIACASTTVRSLPPVGVTDVAACEVRRTSSNNTDIAVSCPDGTVLGRRRVPVGVEPIWLAVAADKAGQHEAELTWVNDVLADADYVLPMRIATATAKTAVVAGIYGVSQPIDAHHRNDVWCVAGSSHSQCRLLLQTLFTTTNAPGSSTSETKVQLRSRSITLPAVCAIEDQSDTGGRYRCEGALLVWQARGTRADVEAEADGMMGSVDDTFSVVPCQIGNDARCFAGSLLTIGVATIDGTPVIARCAGTDVGTSAACKALLQLEQQ